MDVKKLMTIVQAVAKKGDLKTINTVTSMLSNYDHICIGFRMKK